MADEEMNDDAGEADDASPPRFDLTDAELHDVVVAASAKNEFEAIALVDILEGSGIPALKRAGLVHFGGGGSYEVMVPRKTLDAAKTEVELSRSQANERGVEQAFSTENIKQESQNADRDPVVAAMLGLARLPLAERRERLAPRVADWIADGMPTPEIARYLACAELNRTDAESLVNEVNTSHSHLLVESLNRRVATGWGVTAMGVLAFISPFFGAFIPFIQVVGACLMVAGLGIVAISKSGLAKFEK